MMLSPNIFRAYDIRGIVDKEFDEEGARLIGKAYGTYLIRTSKKKNTPFRICIGRDGRTHGERLTNACIQGILSTGIDVVDMGMIPSPLVYFAICAETFDGGVVVTASHNPKEFNGFKLQRDHAHAICGEELQEIRQLIEQNDFETGEGSLSSDDIQQRYEQKICSMFQAPHKGTIVIDAGNGITGPSAPSLFRKLGYKVIELFCEVDGDFPNHPADPEEKENLQDLQKAVKEHQADFGLAFDGDGDRLGVVDRTGWIVPIDFLILTLAQDALSRNPGATIIHDLKASLILPDEIRNKGGIPQMAKVGHSFIEEKMRETGAIFGGEVSGHLFFAEDSFGFDDALLAGARFLDTVLQKNMDIQKEYEALPKTYKTSDYKFACPDEKKFDLIEQLADKFKETYPISRLDGVRIDYGEGDWAVIRASNTSPKINFQAEARTPEKRSEIEKEVFAILREMGIFIEK